MQQKNGKEPAAGEKQIELNVYQAIGRARGQERQGHQLAVVAYRQGQLY